MDFECKPIFIKQREREREKKIEGERDIAVDYVGRFALMFC